MTFAPTVSLGVTPVTTICTPASGTSFAVGTTLVNCIATDARQRSASCAFSVVVQPPPRINFTRFAAFGDSITWGEDGIVPTVGSTGAPLWSLLGPDVPTLHVDPDYPTVVQRLLAARFTTQPITVLNNGSRGERAAGATTLSRFMDMTSSRLWEVVLLMEGSNDIFDGNPSGIPLAIANLRRMIGDARSRGIRVLLATVPPMRPGGSRAAGAFIVADLNAQIRTLAVAEGVPLVDIFDAFNGNLALLASDGLHPNAQGYAVMAARFYDVIRREFEPQAINLTGPTPFAAATTPGGRGMGY